MKKIWKEEGICNKCSQPGLIIKPGLRCQKCVTALKLEWQARKVNRKCAYCEEPYKPKAKDKECSVYCKLMNHREIENDCWLWTGVLSTQGYGKTRHDKKDCVVSRLSFELFKGPIEKGLFVLHKCDKPRCFNPDHLWAGTQKENIIDCSRKGRLLFGESNKNSILKTNQVVEIKKMLKAGHSVLEISKKFNIQWTHVDSIKKEKLWKHITIKD